MRSIKTRLEKLSIIMVAIGLSICILLIFQYFLLGGLCFILFLLISWMWTRCLFEELVISFLKRKGGSCFDTDLIQVYTPKILSVVSRLEKKGIVSIEDKKFVLLELNRKCTFDTYR